MAKLIFKKSSDSAHKKCTKMYDRKWKRISFYSMLLNVILISTYLIIYLTANQSCHLK